MACYIIISVKEGEKAGRVKRKDKLLKKGLSEMVILMRVKGVKKKACTPIGQEH